MATHESFAAEADRFARRKGKPSRKRTAQPNAGAVRRKRQIPDEAWAMLPTMKSIRLKSMQDLRFKQAVREPIPGE